MADISKAFRLLKLHGGLHPSQHHFDFLALPGELRNQIYRLTLTSDPPRLERGHKYSCKWCTWDPDEPQNRMVDYHGETLPGCSRCWVRRGLALLLANRKIHEEAAPIFWAENHFSFQGFQSFIRLVGGSVRPQYRQVIHHVTVYLDPGRKWDLRIRTSRHMWLDLDLPPVRFWDILFQCKGLRTLELPPYPRHLVDSSDVRVVDAELASWDRLTSELPNLMTFSWSYFEWGLSIMPIHHIPRAFDHPFRITKRFDLTVVSPDQLRRCGPCTPEDIRFSRFYCFRDSPFGPLGPLPGKFLVSTRRMEEYRRSAARMGYKDELELTHPEGMPTDWFVEFFFLPLSPETIARNSTLRARDELLRRRRWMPSTLLRSWKLLRQPR